MGKKTRNQRISERFLIEVELINQKREKLGLPIYSMSKITSMLTKHILFTKIKEDLIKEVWEDE